MTGGRLDGVVQREQVVEVRDADSGAQLRLWAGQAEPAAVGAGLAMQVDEQAQAAGVAEGDLGQVQDQSAAAAAVPRDRRPRADLCCPDRSPLPR
jgi:hypothetical protein